MMLTAAQRQAVERLGQDVCVTAGPGSGKTRVLVERFTWLVTEGHAEAARVLAITFTEKAALEIKQRLLARFDGDERQSEILRAPVSTIDGFAARLLRENAIAAGLDPEFRILDERTARLLERQSADEALDAILRDQPQRLRQLYTRWSVTDPAGELIDCYEAIRLAGDGWPQHQPLSPDHETLELALRDLDRRYRATKRRASALDFGDLCEQAVLLLESDEKVREDTAWRFDFILMDELQDTNPLQWRLMELVRRAGRFFGVGDINQAIYGFRHATPEAFRQFRDGVKDSGGTVDRLAENFRSRAEILSKTELVCGVLAGMERPGLKAAREFPAQTEPAVELLGAEHPDKDTRARLEALAVCQRIQDLSARFRYREMAILMRSRTRYGVFAKALTECGIPYLMTDSREFFERQEVRDCLNWLRALANPLDEIAILGIARSPLGGLDDEAILRARQLGGPLWAALGDPLAQLIEQRRRLDSAPADLLLGEALDASDYWSLLDTGASANVTKFLDLVRAGTAEMDGTVAGAVDYIERLRAANDEPDAPQLGVPDAVRILTIHGAKGLEFPVVFLSALDSQPRGDGASLVYAPGRGLGAKWRSGDESERDGIASDLHEAQKDKEKEESARLLYVGMTRAEQKLILSYGFTRTKTGKISQRGWVKWLAALGGPAIASAGSPDEISGARQDRSADAQVRPAERIVAPPPRSAMVPEVLSARTIALFDICPRRAQLEGVLQLPVPVQHDREKLIDTGRQRFSKRAGADGPAEPSVPYVVAIAGRLVEGEADAILPGPPPRLVHFASIRNMDASRTEAAIAAYALDRLGQPVDDLMVISESATPLLRAWPGAERSRTEARVERAFAAAEAGYPLNEGEHCRQCPYWKAACPSRFGAEQLALFGEI